MFTKFFVLTILLFSNVAFANPSKSDLDRIREQQRIQKNVTDKMNKQALKVENEIMAQRKKMIKTAKDIQEYEEKISNFELELQVLKAKYSNLKRKLVNHNEQIIGIMGALQSLSLRPIDTMILMPINPTDILRGGILLRESVPMVKKSAEKINKDLQELEDLREIIKNQYDEIKSASKNLNKQNAYMETLLKNKRELQKKLKNQANVAEKKSVELAKKANNLKSLLDKLNKEKIRQAEIKRRNEQKMANLSFSSSSSFAKARGQLPYPVRGNIIKKYGETDNKTGMQNKGIIIKGRKNAQVIAPYDGTVLFSGPFRGYGNLLIIDHSEKYMTLLAGMDRIDSHVGQNLLSGEPVGVMGHGEDVSLYLEIRRDGNPVNPLPWLTSGK